MRILFVGLFTCVLGIGCSDVAPVLTTVVHIDLAASGCDPAICSPNSWGADTYCGPYSETKITPTTTHLEVSADVAANELVGYTQLQYDNVGNGNHHEDSPLQAGERTLVTSPYDGETLYWLTAAGEPIEIAADRLTSREGSTLTFGYEVHGTAKAVVEVHHIDEPRVIHVETDPPGLDVCCSVGRPQDGALLVLALLGGLRLGRRRR